jgi:hypothetical protein
LRRGRRLHKRHSCRRLLEPCAGLFFVAQRDGRVRVSGAVALSHRLICRMSASASKAGDQWLEVTRKCHTLLSKRETRGNPAWGVLTMKRSLGGFIGCIPIAVLIWIILLSLIVPIVHHTDIVPVLIAVPAVLAGISVFSIVMYIVGRRVREWPEGPLVGEHSKSLKFEMRRDEYGRRRNRLLVIIAFVVYYACAVYVVIAKLRREGHRALLPWAPAGWTCAIGLSGRDLECDSSAEPGRLRHKSYLCDSWHCCRRKLPGRRSLATGADNFCICQCGKCILASRSVRSRRPGEVGSSCGRRVKWGRLVVGESRGGSPRGQPFARLAKRRLSTAMTQWQTSPPGPPSWSTRLGKLGRFGTSGHAADGVWLRDLGRADRRLFRMGRSFGVGLHACRPTSHVTGVGRHCSRPRAVRVGLSRRIGELTDHRIAR